MTAAAVRTLAGNARTLWPITALATIVAVGARWGPDWPAQEFRAWLAGSVGLVSWTTRWYGGQPLPGYSVLYPLLAGVAGAGGAGVLAVVAAAAGAETLRPPVGPAAALCYRAAVALTLVESLITGQIPFLMGAACGVWALWSARAGHWPVALACAMACSLCSPLPGLFLLLIAPAWAMVTSWRQAVPLAGAVTGIGVSLAVGGASGPFPFPWSSFVGVLGCAVAMAAVAGAKHRPLLIFACCYGAFSVAAFIVPNPVGGNAARLGKLVVLPLAVLVIARSTSRRTLPGLAALAVVWTGVPFVTGAAHGVADPSRQPGYYTGLTAFLRTQDPTTGRLEIPFTRGHWEAMWVAQKFPIARGWERQTDMQANEVLYDTLTPTAYRTWLDENGVRLVALPDVTIDAGGRAEAALLQHGLPYLHEVWHNADWRVWRVADAVPIATGAASMTALRESSFSLTFHARGTATVRLRASSLWQVTTGSGCVSADPDGWLSVSSNRPGPLTVSAEMSLGTLTAGTRSCSDEPASAP